MSAKKTSKSAKASPTNRLKILSYNIHKGFSLENRFVLHAIKEAIQSTGVELAFLQEVIGENSKHSKKHRDWPVQPQLEFLADSIWTHHAYGKNAVYTEGHHGNAILSQRQMTSWENIDISNNRFERRGLLHATIELESESTTGRAKKTKQKELHLICVHLDLFEKGRRAQIQKIVSRIHDHVPDDCPLIIAGDFNDWRENASDALADELGVKEVFQTLHGKHARSFPSWFPFMPLDRIYIRGFEPVEARCFTASPWDRLSDHGALLAELAF